MHEDKDQDQCPKCGSELTESTGNMLEYPDHWEKVTCLKCDWLVGLIDNSPYVSCYEFEDFVIEI